MGFEVIVRPVVLPNIRPRPARTPLPPSDDPEKGLAVIRGNGFRQGTTSRSVSVSSSQSRPTEIKRRSDEVRVYQKKDDGTINKANFVDLLVADKIWSDVGAGPSGNSDLDAHMNSNTKTETRTDYFTPAKEDEHIEVRKRGIITTRDSE